MIHINLMDLRFAIRNSQFANFAKLKISFIFTSASSFSLCWSVLTAHQRRISKGKDGCAPLHRASIHLLVSQSHPPLSVAAFPLLNCNA